MKVALEIRAFATAGFLTVAAAVSGCTAQVYPPTVGGYTTVYATSVPPDMTIYPRVSYAGSYAYLVGNRWYYPSRGNWVVLRQEPPELYRYRTTYVAPPAYARPAPPGYGRPAPPGYAPRQLPPNQYGYPPR
jgi:hypothetical protein